MTLVDISLQRCCRLGMVDLIEQPKHIVRPQTHVLFLPDDEREMVNWVFLVEDDVVSEVEVQLLHVGWVGKPV